MITLIPKVKELRLVIEFRLISFYTMVHIVISKTIANKLKFFLPTIISSKQSALVSGRCILNNVLVSFEIMHKLKAHRKGKKALMTLKFDMSKVYDPVE